MKLSNRLEVDELARKRSTLKWHLELCDLSLKEEGILMTVYIKGQHMEVFRKPVIDTVKEILQVKILEVENGLKALGIDIDV